MKATGIVRRIDDLGRIVVPKEIRRTLRIREGDPLEIYTGREGEIMLKKYSPIAVSYTHLDVYKRQLQLGKLGSLQQHMHRHWHRWQMRLSVLRIVIILLQPPAMGKKSWKGNA